MEVFVCKLTADRLEDFLGYFDKDAFSDNDEWCGCYCMCYHWDKELRKKRAWNCDKAHAELNREQAIRFIQSGRMQGYLAYMDGKVVGWCNANDKKAYDNVNFDIPSIPDTGEKTKSIVCFSVAPPYRGLGIAKSLLRFVCEDAKQDGFSYAEAYPFAHNEYHAYHGPVSLYENAGFQYCDKIEGCKIYRKKL